MTTKTKKLKSILKSFMKEDYNPDYPIVVIPDSDKEILQLIESIRDGIDLLKIYLVSTNSGIKKEFEVKSKHYLNLNTKLMKGCTGDAVICKTLDPKFLQECKKEKVVPIASGGLIATFNAVEETGNGFSYDEKSGLSLYAALVRLAETYQFPYDWKTLLKGRRASVKV